MTFITDQLAHLDAQLDRLQLDRLPAAAAAAAAAADHDYDHDSLVSPFTRSFSHRSHAALTPSTHTQNLQSLIKALSALPNRPLTPHRIVTLLQSASLDPAPAPSTTTHTLTSATASEHSAHDLELEWILLSKATIQTYGIVLNSLLAQTLPLTQDMFYWDSVVSSPLATALYTLQTAPSRATAFTTEILSDALRRLRELREMERIPVLPGPYTIDHHDHSYGRIELPQPEWLEAPSDSDSLSLTARKFYALVRNALHEREWRMGAVSPLALARHEIGRKRAAVRRLREMKASALGVLIGEGLSFGFEDAAASGAGSSGGAGGEDGDEWKGIVERAVTLMENVVRNVSTVDTTLDEFEETVFALDKPSSPSSSSASPTTATGAGAAPPRPTAALARQLIDILTVHLPAQTATSRSLITTHGRPSALTRYWIPLTALLLSSTTLLRLLSSRRAALATWLRDLGATTIDFWNNWVIDPLRSLIGTIRHSADSEVALMSRDSLAADMLSLERMVVDFATDNPAMASSAGGPLTDAALDGVRARVKMGDLTPVLRAYERDLRRPLRGAVAGELVRALLIQVQKTKVDVEVAISGIDRLLKSQELVFGMVGLTPGVLVCVGLVQWVRGCVGGRRGRRSWARAGEMVRVLRNVDRILGGSRGLLRGENGGMLSYKEHGLLMCEVHVLREFARGVLPRGVRAEFVEDVEELVDVRRGVRGQLRVVERVRWAYAKWIK